MYIHIHTYTYIYVKACFFVSVIEAKNVVKKFGDRTLIEDLTFSIPPGAIVGIVGPNGAGKTTLLRMLTGEQTPDDGELTVGKSVKMVRFR